MHNEQKPVSSSQRDLSTFDRTQRPVRGMQPRNARTSKPDLKLWGKQLWLIRDPGNFGAGS